jgi:hypothetical protein
MEYVLFVSYDPTDRKGLYCLDFPDYNDAYDYLHRRVHLAYHARILANDMSEEHRFSHGDRGWLEEGEE